MMKKFGDQPEKEKKGQQDYLEEARQIEKELENMEDPWENDDQIEEEMRRRIYREIMTRQQKKLKKASWIQRAGKYAAMVVITLVALFSVTMTSQATRQRFIKSFSYLIGKDEAIEISTTDNLDDSDMEEEHIIAEIEEKIECEYPIFMYRPKQFSFQSYTIYEKTRSAHIEYNYSDQILFLYITKGEEDFVSKLMHQGEIKDRFEIEVDQINIEVTEREDEGDMQPAYVAHWIYDNCYYDISGKMEKEEFIKFLKNIRF